MATGRVPTTANSPLTAKGDLFGYSTTQARVAVGNDGETLVADSSTSTGLRYQSNFAAGKNKVINGDFGIWQRGTTFTGPALFTYTADRFQTICNGTVGGLVISQQTFTPGTAPVAGYEGSFFLRQVVTSQSGGSVQAIATRLEDVRTFAGQTVTFSFWGKSDTSRTWGCRFVQNFGSGGSAEVNIAGSTSLSVTTAWTRFTVTVSVPSISGKTIGTGSYFYIIIDGAINTAQTLDIWGVQLEAGSVATAFQTATGTIQGELAACQRYYFRNVTGAAYGRISPFGNAAGATGMTSWVVPPVPMRTTPTAIEYSSNLALGDNVASIAVTGITLSGQSNNNYIGLDVTVASGLTTYRPYNIIGNNSTTAYIAASAEL